MNIGREGIIVSFSNSLSLDISENLLSTLFQQLPKPVILTGDFNIYHQIWGNPVKDNRRYQALNFINNNQLNILNDGRHTRTSGNPKLETVLTAHPILECQRQYPLSSDHCVITVNVQRKILEPQSTIIKFNTNEVSWQLFTSNETWNKSQIQIDHNLLKL